MLIIQKFCTLWRIEMGTCYIWIFHYIITLYIALYTFLDALGPSIAFWHASSTWLLLHVRTGRRRIPWNVMSRPMRFCLVHPLSVRTYRAFSCQRASISATFSHVAVGCHGNAQCIPFFWRWRPMWSVGRRLLIYQRSLAGGLKIRLHVI